jgi:hypothetical protein
VTPRELSDLEWERWKGRVKDVLVLVLGTAIIVIQLGAWIFQQRSPDPAWLVAAGGLIGFVPVSNAASKRGPS